MSTGIAIAGVSAAAAYLDAKYHIRKDLADIREKRKIAKIAEKQGTNETLPKLQGSILKSNSPSKTQPPLPLVFLRRASVELER